MRVIRQTAALTLFLLTSCVFETRVEDPNRPGFLSLEINLRAQSNALLKRASADTIFRLDSLIVELSSSGQATTTYGYPLSGRADTGNISVTPKIFALAPLRTWKAKICTIDTSPSPVTRDTVHLDSFTFSVNPGDTAIVSKTISPVFSILRVRLVSNSPTSITNNVKYVRIRVDGVTRDSTIVGQTLRAISFGGNSNGVAVGDSGTIIRTVNSGVNWAAVISGVTTNLNGVSFPSANTGYAVGDGGVALKTTTGTVWIPQITNTSANLNATNFTGNSSGFAVGDSGVILKSNGSTWTTQTSNTTKNLNGLCFTSGSTGTVVGNAGTILRTTSTGSSWTAQTSGTTRNLNAVFFLNSSNGFAVGDSGTILKTTNNGSTWNTLNSGTTKNLTGVYFSSTNQGWAVGDSGTLLTTSNGTNWSALPSHTTMPLIGLDFTPNNNAADAVGASGAIVGSTDGGDSWAYQPFGTKSFDLQLTYKYLKPNVQHTLIMDAIDTVSGTLRGYQATKTVTLSPGKDTTVTPNASLSKCGYSGFSNCTP